MRYPTKIWHNPCVMEKRKNVSAPPKKLFIKTWGCQMNVYDSARMADVLESLGYVTTDDPAEADLVVFNTCHIREKASEKLYSDLGRMREHKDARAAKGQTMLIAVAGCVAQAVGEEIQRRAPYVDLVFGPQTYHQLSDMLAEAALRARRVLNLEFPVVTKFERLPVAQINPDVSAFLVIQEGCDRFCSYCVVPYTRGAEYARPFDAILKEAKELASKGVREITLLGQNVNAWRDGDLRLGHLLERLGDIPNLLRLRYTTSHPLDVTDDLVAAHRHVPQLMPFLHLPAQSGSDRILAAMNRKHTAGDYMRLVDKLKKARPDLALSSDFIVGFPGETDADFEATLRLVRDIGYAQAFSFKYSRRPGTPAAGLTEQIPLAVKNARIKELQTLLSSQQEAFNAACAGQTMPVLFESPARRKGHIFGRTAYMQTVLASGQSDSIGHERLVRITQAGKNNLTGVLA